MLGATIVSLLPPSMSARPFCPSCLRQGHAGALSGLAVTALTLTRNRCMTAQLTSNAFGIDIGMLSPIGLKLQGMSLTN